VNFLTVYVKEIHTADEWEIGENKEDGICYPFQPTTLEQRALIARDFVEKFDYKIPLVLDGMNNAVKDAYGAWPKRLYVIDSEGFVVYKGGLLDLPGKAKEIEYWLK